MKIACMGDASVEASAAACNFSKNDARELFPFNFADIGKWLPSCFAGEYPRATINDQARPAGTAARNRCRAAISSALIRVSSIVGLTGFHIVFAIGVSTDGSPRKLTANWQPFGLATRLRSSCEPSR